MRRLALLLLAAAALAPACSSPSGCAWQPCAAFEGRLPPSIRVRELRTTEPPLRAWLVEADPGTDAWEVRVLVPGAGGSLATVPELAAASGSLVAVNAGYFGERGSVSLVVDGGRVVSSPPRTLEREGLRYAPVRAAFGLDRRGEFDVAWAADLGGRVWRYPRPIPIRRGAPQREPGESFPAGGEAWPLVTAVGAGPMLVRSGQPQITWEEEVFFGSGIGQPDEREPRTALGVTQDGRLLLLVVDGRSAESGGVTLPELARMLVEAGAGRALSLDGGGSTTLVVAGELVNRPCDPRGPRAVASALALVPRRSR
jgi:hypothetical protein